MKNISFSWQVMGTLAALALGSQSLPAQTKPQVQHYTVTDLGPVGPAGQPFYVTNNGLVSGASAADGGNYRAVIWYGGFKTELGSFGGENSTAYGVNVRAQVVGWAESDETDPYGEDFCGFGSHHICLPFIWQFGLMTPLTTLGGKSGTAYMINDRSQAAGFTETASVDPACPPPQKYQFKPVLWTAGTIQALPTVALDPDGIAYNVNDNGQAVGASGICAAFNPITLVNLQPLHALLWEKGVATDLGNLGGTGHGQGISASSINNQGQVVGVSDLPGDESFHAFLWTRGTGMQDLGTLSGDAGSLAIANNDAGSVVGVSLDDEFNPRAFVWRDGAMSDLNALIPADSPLYLWTACSINSRGEIIGIAATSDGDLHGYMASPSNGAPSAASSSIADLRAEAASSETGPVKRRKLPPGRRVHY